MNTEAQEHYKPLPGRGITSQSHIFSTTRYRLWLGSDHILSVAEEGYTARYGRFFFKDVQGFIVRRTWTREWLTIPLLAGALLYTYIMVALAMESEGSDAAAAFLAIGLPASLFWLAAVINWMRGPTCATYLQTAVQTHHLPSLNRLRLALRVINTLRPLIEGSQQHIPPAPPDSSFGLITNARLETRPPLTPYSGHAHTILFSVLLADALHTLLTFVANNAFISLLGILISIILILSLIAAIVRHADTDLPRSIKGLTLLVAGYLAIAYFMGGLLNLVVAVSYPAAHTDDPLFAFRIVSSLRPYDSYPLLFMSLFSLFTAGTIGSLGLLGALRLRKAPVAFSAPPPLPPIQPVSRS